MKVAGDIAANCDNPGLAIDFYGMAFERIALADEPIDPRGKSVGSRWSINQWNALVRIDILKKQARKCEEARNYFHALWYENEIIRLDGENPSNHSDKGITLWYLHQWDEAKLSFEKAINLSCLEHSPQDPALFNNIASVYTQIGGMGTAEKYLEWAIALKPEKGIYYLNLGDCYWREAQVSKAMDCYHKAADLGCLKIDKRRGDAQVGYDRNYKHDNSRPFPNFEFDRSVLTPPDPPTLFKVPAF